MVSHNPSINHSFSQTQKNPHAKWVWKLFTEHNSFTLENKEYWQWGRKVHIEKSVFILLCRQWCSPSKGSAMFCIQNLNFPCLYLLIHFLLFRRHRQNKKMMIMMTLSVPFSELFHFFFCCLQTQIWFFFCFFKSINKEFLLLLWVWGEFFLGGRGGGGGLISKTNFNLVDLPQFWWILGEFANFVVNLLSLWRI